jgi:hypothetical protein
MNDPGAGPDLISGLLLAQAYPHAVELPIRVVETHVSWVLLTGPYAYKIKKPLKLSFLDYSTVNRRRSLCNEELRLNRRYAPDLYVDVAGIHDTPSGIRIGRQSPGDLEYAVRMRQFETDQELGALLDAGGIDAPAVGELGRHLARFHAAAAPAGSDTRFGLPDEVHRVTLNNFTELGVAPGAAQRQELLGRLRARADSLLASVHGLMAGRRRASRIRECHGDLHCANVVRWKGVLTPFDGIEFDPALRFIDVVSDVAFLSMDLGVHERADLRHALLNAWTGELGDYEGIALLPYFECYRALVRAKVSALRAGQEPGGSQRQRLAVDAAARYLSWADSQSRRAAPRLLLTCGVSGSGKTWLARQLAGRMRALHLRSDIERKRLAGLGPMADSRSAPNGGIYSAQFNAKTYERLYECARSSLIGGESVIVDAAFLQNSTRKQFLALAGELEVAVTILHCTAPESVLRKRIASRQREGHDASEADLAVLERQLSRRESLGKPESTCVIEVDTRDDDSVERVLGALRPTAAES